MDLLLEIIQVLDENDLKKFKVFLKRYRNVKERKDLRLLELLMKNSKIKRTDLLGALYGKEFSLTAYHATRKRLMRQIVVFINQFKINAAKQEEVSEESLYRLSLFLFNSSKNEAAWSILSQAEVMALGNENFSLLNLIYSLQIENSLSEGATELEQIIERKKLYQQLSLEDDKANTAYHLIRYHLNKSLIEGKEIDIASMIQKVLVENDLAETIAKRPKFICNIISITRSSVLVSKDFYSFEPYIVDKYNDVEKIKSFTKLNHQYKIQLLYMIAHVMYRNKKFFDAMHYLQLMNNAMKEFNNLYHKIFYSKYILLHSAVLNYSGNNQKAIDLLEGYLHDKVGSTLQPHDLNTYLNLSTYYFQKGDYSKSIRLFLKLQQSESKLIKLMGMEWVLKKNIIECINQYELGNTDVVDRMIKSMIVKFEEFLNRPLYKRVKIFLNFVTMLNNDPSCCNKKTFINKIESSFDFVGAEREDIQAMTFYAWLKSKIVGKNYYTVLIDLINDRSI